MGEQAALDEQAIVARIREQLRSHLLREPPGGISPRPRTPADTSTGAVEPDLESLRAASDLLDVQGRSSARSLAPIVTTARRGARKLLAPSLRRQMTYNLINERLITALHAELTALRAEQQSLRRECESLKSEVETLKARVERDD